MIFVLDLFPRLNDSLIEVLKGLTPLQWNSTTVCKSWTVKDIATHLLDTSIRRLSIGRDNYISEKPTEYPREDILKFINSLNSEWVAAYKRVSPQVLIKQIEAAQIEFYDYLSTLDLSANAIFPVAWAGEEQSQNWFDIAREYTERWHHQQQIRLAVGAKSILDRDLYHPFLQICMLALPFHYRFKSANEGTVVKINVVGDAGGSWSIIRCLNAWEFTYDQSETATQVYIDQNIAWLLFSRGIDIFESEQYWQVLGDYDLGFHALKMTSFMI